MNRLSGGMKIDSQRVPRVSGDESRLLCARGVEAFAALMDVLALWENLQNAHAEPFEISLGGDQNRYTCAECD